MDPEHLLGPKDRRSNEIRKLVMADSQFPMQFHNPHSVMPTNGFELFSMFGAPDPTSSRDSSISQSTGTTPKPLTKRQIEYRRLKESPEEYQMQLEKMRITRKNYYRRFRSNPVKWQEHLKRVAERRQNMPPDKIAQRLQKQREWRRANYMEARTDPEKWKLYLKKRSEERKRKKERIRNGDFGSDTSAVTSLNVTNSSNETDFGSPSDSHGAMMTQPKWNYYGFGSGAATPVSMKLQGPMDSVAESALPFSLSVLLEPNVQVVEQEHHNMAGTSSGSFLNIPKVTAKYEDYKPTNMSAHGSGGMFPSKHHQHLSQQQQTHPGSFHKQSHSTPSHSNGGGTSSSSSYHPKHSTPVHAHTSSSSSSTFNHKHSTPNHHSSSHHNTSHNGSYHKNQSSSTAHHQPPLANAHQNSPLFHKQHQLPPSSSSGLPPNQHHQHHHNINNGAMFQDYLQKLTAGQQRTPTKQELPVPTPGYFDMNNMSQHFSQQYGQSPYRFTPTPQFAAYASANHVHEPVPRYQPEPPTPPQPTPKKLTRRQLELRRLKESPEKYRDFLQKQRESRKKGYLKCREDPQKWQEHLVKVSEKRKQKKLETSSTGASSSSNGGGGSAEQKTSTVDHQQKAVSFQQAAAAAASLAAVASGNLNLTHRMDGNLDLSDHSLLPYALRTML